MNKNTFRLPVERRHVKKTARRSPIYRCREKSTELCETSTERGDGNKPVSYTHLDVYKRQL